MIKFPRANIKDFFELEISFEFQVNTSTFCLCIIGTDLVGTLILPWITE